MKLSTLVNVVTLLVCLFAVVHSVSGVTPLTSATTTTIVSSTIKNVKRSTPNSIREKALVKKELHKNHTGLVHKKKSITKAVKAATATNNVSQTTSNFTFRTKAIIGFLVMVGLEQAVKQFFITQGISFPAQLAGCILLFLVMIVMNIILPGSGDVMYQALGPTTTLLTQWLPVFFVPGLAMLPLAPNVGSAVEVAKILLITCLGFVYSLLTVAYSVLFLRKATGKVMTTTTTTTTVSKNLTTVWKKPKSALSTSTAAAAVVQSPPKPYGDSTMTLLAKMTIVSGIVSVLMQVMMSPQSPQSYAVFAKLVQTCFFFSATLATYVWGARLPNTITKTIHPLLTSTILIWVGLYWYGIATNYSQGTFIDIIQTYKTGSLSSLTKVGAGDMLLYLLGPSVISFAVSMYSKKQLLKENFWIVVVSMMVSSLGGLFGTAGFVKFIQLGGVGVGSSAASSALVLRLSMLARNITTALAIPVTQILGGDISIAVVVVVLTGILGAQYGRRILDLVGIQDPVTRGLAVGCSAQGLGVSSMVAEADAFPFAAMAMVLTAVAGTVLVSIPQIKDALVSICS